MSDIWLAIAREGRPTPPSSSRPLSDRAAARASRPRPWVQSQTRVKSQTPLTSKADMDLAASMAAAEARLAARRDEHRQNAAAQSALAVSLKSDSPRVEYPPPPSVRSQIPAPVGSIARERKLLCLCGKELCVNCQHRVAMNARSIARREQETAELAAEKAEREEERLSRSTQPQDFRRRMRELERLAKDMAEERKSPPFPVTFRSA
ncbi:MAG: hypothetical protein LQ347_005043 [Umbilicaria vellea]|nr:MAG: hypothetical protein LQ347_005043 [Umbilicaria vellea]